MGNVVPDQESHNQQHGRQAASDFAVVCSGNGKLSPLPIPPPSTLEREKKRMNNYRYKHPGGMGRFLSLPIFFETFAPLESAFVSGFSSGAPRGRDFKDEEAMRRRRGDS